MSDRALFIFAVVTFLIVLWSVSKSRPDADIPAPISQLANR